MEKEIINKYLEAGRIWKNAIKLTQKKAKEGKLFLDLAEDIESLIIEEGAEVGFPTNLSINEEAAHFTPDWKDSSTLKESDLLKIDIGVSVDGYICDGAISINLDNTHSKMIEANEKALENAISVVGFDKPISNIGKEIESTIKKAEFNPVYNLGGHGLERFSVHAEPSLSNHSRGSDSPLEEGAIAIEPFASTGEGFVSESSKVEIFALTEKKPVRGINARKILAFAEKFNGLPFAERWIRKETKLNDFQATFGLRELMKNDAIETFPGLKEEKGTFVSQVEKSMLVLEDKVIILGE